MSNTVGSNVPIVGKGINVAIALIHPNVFTLICAETDVQI